MILRFKLIIIFILLPVFIYAFPDYLIEGEEAVIGPRLDLAVQSEGIYHKTYLDDWGIRPRLCLGIFEWVEVNIRSSLNFFPELQSHADLYTQAYPEGYSFNEVSQNTRLSFFEPGIKIRLWNFKSEFNLVLFYRYKHFLGQPIIIPYPEGGQDDSAIAVVSQNASGGRQMTWGLAAKIPLSSDPFTKPSLNVSADFSYLWEKDWQETFRQSDFRLGVNISPQVLFLKHWMIQLENRFEWWFNRGFHYEVLPGIAREVRPGVSFHAGVGLPVFGGDVTRIFLGFKYHFQEGKVRIRIYDIHFPPDSSNLFGFGDKGKVEKNKEILDKLYKQLQGYPDYDITIEGHTSSVHYKTEAGFNREQRNILIPLSLSRAKAVKQALVQRGLSASRIKTSGKGGSEPLVPFRFRKRQWRNRRVDIVLTKSKNLSDD